MESEFYKALSVTGMKDGGDPRRETRLISGSMFWNGRSGGICERFLRCDVIRDLRVNADGELFSPSPEGFFQTAFYDTRDAMEGLGGLQ